MRWVVIVVVGLIGAVVLFAVLDRGPNPVAYGPTPYAFPNRTIIRPGFPQATPYLPPPAASSTPSALVKFAILGIGLGLLVIFRKETVVATVGGILTVSGVGALGISIINPSAGSADASAATKYQLPAPPVRQFVPPPRRDPYRR